MEYRQLGGSGLRVPMLAFGTNTFGGRGMFSQVGSTDQSGARRLIHACLDAGVNMFDTADEYSGGLAEEFLGAALKGRRDRALVATKGRTPTGDGPNDRGASRYHLIRACEASLGRLGTDYIDLYQVHAWDGQTRLEETLEALDTLVRSGKVRYVGVCNFSAWQLMKALGVADKNSLERFACHHIHYSLVAREAEYELIPAAIDQALGVLVWSPLAGGLLSGKYRRDRAPTGPARHLTDWNEPPVRDVERMYDTVDVLAEIGHGHGVSAAPVALAWLLGRPGVTSVVIGARTEAQLVENLSALEVPLTAAERLRLDSLTTPGLIYPYWHQAKIAADRLSIADLSLLGPHIHRTGSTAPSLTTGSGLTTSTTGE